MRPNCDTVALTVADGQELTTLLTLPSGLATCTTCNECTQINSRMFAYNENKQAYIADPEAGTFRQLVEAAEGCQVSIIHPGNPHNPKEPGLEDLMRRAAEFI